MAHALVMLHANKDYVFSPESLIFFKNKKQYNHTLVSLTWLWRKLHLCKAAKIETCTTSSLLSCCMFFLATPLYSQLVTSRTSPNISFFYCDFYFSQHLVQLFIYFETGYFVCTLSQLLLFECAISSKYYRGDIQHKTVQTFFIVSV